MLRVRTGARAISNAQAGHGDTLILLDEVNCTGSEEHLVDCGINQNSWGQHDCTHREDAGVLCTMGQAPVASSLQLFFVCLFVFGVGWCGGLSLIHI